MKYEKDKVYLRHVTKGTVYVYSAQLAKSRFLESFVPNPSKPTEEGERSGKDKSPKPNT